MDHARSGPLALGLLALLAGRVLGSDTEPPATPPVAEAAEPTAVGLEDLRSDPRRWLGRRVQFTLQFESVLESWNPYLTRFGRGEWVALSAWADERFTWEAEVFADPMRELFVRRGSPAAGLAELVHAHERFLVVGTVREVFLDRPWIELESLRPLGEIVGAGVILHVGRARRAMAEEQWDLAVDQLERALAAPLPAHARAELERERAECLEHGGTPPG